MIVSFTRLQLEELQHKTTILRDEPDLQESYEVTAEEAEALADLFLGAKPGPVEFADRFAEVLIGELENLIDIDQANFESDGNLQTLAMISSLRGAIRKIKSAGAPRPARR